MRQNTSISPGKLIVTDWNKQLFLFLLDSSRILYACPVHLRENSLLNHIFIGKVQKIDKNIQAAFVEFQSGRYGFLPLEDCKPFYPDLKAGDELIVQISREAVKTKLPVLTAKISVAGNFSVVTRTVQKPELRLSAKLTKEEKIKITHVFNENFPFSEENPDVMIRTKVKSLFHPELDAGPLLKECKILTEQLQQILKKGNTRTCFSCLKEYRPQSWITEILRIPVGEYDEIITDDREFYEKICSLQENEALTEADCENLKDRIRFYEDRSYSLKLLYGIEGKLEHALGRRIWLKSGAYLIIDNTEAMTVIDVNTGKFEPKKEMKEPFLSVNEEAAEEIALQIRLRNLSGMILVDFINMNSAESEKKLLTLMRSLTGSDPVTTDVIDITPLGIMEITRKKIRKPLSEEIGEKCQI